VVNISQREKMSTRNISISLLLAITLGLSGCGGGGGTPDSGTKGNPDPVVKDTTAPVFTNDSDINTNPTIEEGSTSLEIATVVAKDENFKEFKLSGVDKEFFELTETKTRTAYSTVLKFKNSPDYEAKDSPVYNVSVKAIDNKGNSAKKNFVITLTDKPFEFDVTGNMGSVEHDKAKDLVLVTKEAKDSVSYEISGSDRFVLSGNTVTFNAGDFNNSIGANNSYTAIVTAFDQNSKVNLTVKASVVENANMPVIKTYLLDTKTELGLFNINYDYKYTYDENNYLIKVEKFRNNRLIDTTTYRYSDDHKIMEGYNSNNKLDSIRVFEPKKTTKNKFAINTEHSRLSVDEYINYMSEVFDTVSFKNNMHMIKHIWGLSGGQTLAELYEYNDNDKISRILNGNYTISSDDIIDLSEQDLTSSNFPTDWSVLPKDSLSESQLNILTSNSVSMPYQVNGETTYDYVSDDRLAIKGISYIRDENGAFKRVEVHDFNATVDYYNTHVLKMIESNMGRKVTISYDSDSELKSVKDGSIEYKYSFNENGSDMTVTVVSGTKEVATYNFKEE
jgi:hypothetical protein